jgi:hypothetical protein
MPMIIKPERAAGRQCGNCTLCCKLVPVRSIEKPRDTWCSHCDPSRGCKIYDDRPLDCKLWSCLWLIDGDAAERLQPKRYHCVFDVMIDFIGVNGVDNPVAQLWVDPAYPLAYRDPAVHAEIERLGRTYQVPTLVRLNWRGIIVVPACLTGNGVSFEHESKLSDRRTWGDDAWQAIGLTLQEDAKKHG